MTAPTRRTPGVAATVLAADQVSRRYGHTRALDRVSIELRRGSVHGIAGHNGAGKSTLLRILAGAEVPDSGTVRLDGRPATLTSPGAARAAGVACVYQDLSLAGNMTVAENLFLGGELHAAGLVRDRQMNAETAELLEQFDVPARPTDRVGALPVAQRQMIEILRALHRRATFLLLDEPTTALQPQQIDILQTALRQIVREQDVAVAIIDHKLEELYTVADHITAIADGEIVFSAAAADAPRERLVEAIVGTRDRRTNAAALAPDRALHASGGRGIEHPPSPTTRSDHALRLSGLRTNRLAGIDLAVDPGEVLGIYGLVGSGRSRTLRTLMGLEPVTAGAITLYGKPFAPRSPAEAIRAGVAYCSEERKADGFIPGTDAYDNAVLPVLSRYSRLGIVRRRDARAAAATVLADLDIRGDVGGPIDRLSGGNQQKAVLGKALLQRPRLLLLDEPTKGIDIGTKAEIHGIIRRLAHEDDVAVIVVSSEEEEVLAVADSVLVMRGGRTDGPRRPVGDFSVLGLRRLALGADGHANRSAPATP